MWHFDAVRVNVPSPTQHHPLSRKIWIFEKLKKRKKVNKYVLLFFPQFCVIFKTCIDVIYNPVPMFLKLCLLKGNFVTRPVNIKRSKGLIIGMTNYRGIRSIRPPEPSLWNIFEFIPWYFSMLLINNHYDVSFFYLA